MENNELNINETEPKKEKKANKPKRLHSQFLLKKGGYSAAIIALVLAVLILLNWLVGVLGDRFHLEFDMSPEKVNSISAQNLKFIEGIDTDVSITVCSAEETYPSYMSSYAQNYYSISSGGDYYEQTVKLLNKYKSYNKKISVEFVDPQSSEFTAVSQKYANSDISYGDIIVSSEKNGNERYKKVGFTDIYEIETDDTYAMYGMTTGNITGNNIETALTSAIAYCISSKTPKAVIYTGHSQSDYSSSYVELLKLNNFEVDVMATALITEVPDEYDVAVIMAPTSDFVKEELDAISAFLDNNGKLSKGLIYFADSASPKLPNLEALLNQWGIAINSGLIYETNSQNTLGDPFTMGMYPSEEESDSFDNSILKDISFCIAGYNVPLSITEPSDADISVNAVMNSLNSTVIAPIGASSEWSEYSDADKNQYQSVIEAKKSDYNSDNELITSYVYAFGSTEYIDSDWAQNSRVSNKDIVLACSERASGVSDSKISFTPKTITNESYSDSVTESSVRVIRIIFMVLLPIITIIIGAVIYFKRRNA